jgi:MFS family permease
MNSDSTTVGSGDRPGRAVLRSSMGVIAALVLAECVSAFEAGMIFLALPRFGEIFGAPASTTAWAVTAYMLVAATAALVGGRLGDLYGRKRVLVIVMLLSAAGSFISVFGDSMEAIIAGRAVQGVAGAIMPLCYGLAREALPSNRVALGIGFVGGAGLLAGAGGSLIAGRILDVWDWHLIFVFAAVLAFVASAAVVVSIPRSTPAGHLPRFDVLGAILLTPGLSAVLFGLTQGSKWGWTSASVVGLIASGVAILTLWTLWELRQEIPLINLRVLKLPSVSLTMVATGILSLGPIGAAMILSPIILLSPTSLPVGLGLSATAMGVLTATGGLVGFAVGPLAGLFAGRVGGRGVLAVGAVLFVGYSLIIYVGYDSVAMMVLALVVGAVATAFCFTAFPKLIIESVPADATSETTGVMVTARQAFSAIGVAIASVILSSSTISGTTVPSVDAIRGCLIFFIVCSMLALVACAVTGRRRTVDRSPVQREDDPSQAEPAPNVTA